MFIIGLFLALLFRVIQTFAPDVITPKGKEPTDRTGLNVADTFTFVNDGNTRLEVKNANIAITKVKIKVQTKVAGRLVAEEEVEVAKEKLKIFGPFDRATFNSEEEKVEFTLTSAEGVTLRIFKG